MSALDADWVKGLSDSFRERLRECGLIVEQQDTAESFIDAVDAFIVTMRKWERSTRRNWEQHRRRAFLYFANRPHKDITAGDARDFKQFMRGTLLVSENTARKTIAACRQVFGWLMAHEKADKNPFLGQGVAVGKTANQRYVPADVVEQLLKSCSNHEWRLMFVLARYGGLRCPSEPFSLKWSDVNWDLERMTVYAPKTKQQRLVPLFPDLWRHLSQIHAELPEGSPDWMMPRLRETSGSLHGPAYKIIQRANVERWPRTFHNLRSSCQTDLSDLHPMSAVCAWLGNSAAVASKHYLQVTEAHFAAAVKRPAPTSEAEPRRQTADTRADECDE